MENGEADKGGETGIGNHRGRMPRGVGERNTAGRNIPDLQQVQKAGARKVQRASEGDSDSDSGERGKLPDVRAEVTAKTEQAAQENPRGSNLVIIEKSKFPTTPKTRFKANVEAIRVLRTLMQENRYATQAEQEILAKYTISYTNAQACGRIFCALFALFSSKCRSSSAIFAASVVISD